MRNEHKRGSATKARSAKSSRYRGYAIFAYNAAGTASGGQWSFFRSNGNKGEGRATWRAALKGGRTARVYEVRGNVNHTSK